MLALIAPSRDPSPYQFFRLRCDIPSLGLDFSPLCNRLRSPSPLPSLSPSRWYHSPSPTHREAVPASGEASSSPAAAREAATAAAAVVTCASTAAHPPAAVTWSQRRPLSLTLTDGIHCRLLPSAREIQPPIALTPSHTPLLSPRSPMRDAAAVPSSSALLRLSPY